ncbi:MAG TPA: hypothetical protein VNO22_12840 [Planctomycetota bacterium]|jgi:hypothetical protein|nr:hypothetical protein [Planctomycetota bacterium]
MKRIGEAAPTFLVLAVLASPAWAQGRGADFGDRFNRIEWYPSMEKAMTPGEIPEFERRRLMRLGLEPQEKKYIFVYVRPPAETREPDIFNGTEFVQASHGPWAFVKMDFDKESPYIKAWGLRSAPSCVGCDIYGNDFLRTSALSIDQLRRILIGTPQAVLAYEQKLRQDFARAMELVKSDETRGIKALVDIVLTGRSGYREVGEAQSRLAELGESALRRAELGESVSPEAGIEALEEVVRTFRATPPGVQAEIRIARWENERGNPSAAIQRLNQVLKHDSRLLKTEIETAAKLLEEISRAGEAKLELALTGDRTSAREAARKIARDYAGTEAGRRAAEAARRLE